MAQVAVDAHETRLRDGIVEMKRLILAAFPEARFSIELGEDPAGTYLIATVDVEDTDEVIDVFIDRLVQLQVDEGLRLHVLPLTARSQGSTRI